MRAVLDLGSDETDGISESNHPAFAVISDNGTNSGDGSNSSSAMQSTPSIATAPAAAAAVAARKEPSLMPAQAALLASTGEIRAVRV